MSNKVTLTGHFTLLDGTPAVGTVLIRPSRSPILDLDGNTVIVGPQRFALDVEGRFSVNLPPTDAPALGEKFTYHVTVTMHHTHWQIAGLTLPVEMTSVDVLDPPAGVVKEYPTRAEWDALTEATLAEMETALDGAETARDQSVDARDATVVARDDTLTARDTAVGARDTAVGVAGEAETARTETLTARGATLTARDITVEARDATLTARDTAVGAAGGAEATLAGKVTGQGMTLRHDNSVGERVFLDHPGGSTMLYGDTGWRDITDALINGWTAKSIHIRRVNSTVYFRYLNLSSADASSATAFYLPTGFSTTVSGSTVLLTRHENATPAYMQVWDISASIPTSYFSTVVRRGVASWETSLSWPTTPFGTP